MTQPTDIPALRELLAKNQDVAMRSQDDYAMIGALPALLDELEAARERLTISGDSFAGDAIDLLNARCYAYQTAIELAETQLEAYKADAAAKVWEAKALRGALGKFGAHHIDGCSKAEWSMAACTCGLDEALSEANGAQ